MRSSCLVDVYVTVLITVVCFVAVRMWNVKTGQYGAVLIEHFALCHAIHAFV